MKIQIIMFCLFCIAMLIQLVSNIGIINLKKFNPNATSRLYALNILSLVITMVTGSFLAYFTIVLGPQSADETKAFQEMQMQNNKKTEEYLVNIQNDIKTSIIVDEEPIVYDENASAKEKFNMITEFEETVSLTNGNKAKYKNTVITRTPLASKPEENIYYKIKGTYGAIKYYNEEKTNWNIYTWYVYDLYEEIVE